MLPTFPGGLLGFNFQIFYLQPFLPQLHTLLSNSMLSISTYDLSLRHTETKMSQNHMPSFCIFSCFHEWPETLFPLNKLKKIIYLFGCDCLSCGMPGFLLKHAGFSLVAVYRLSYPSAGGILVPWLGMESMSPELQGRFLTTGPQGKSLHYIVLTICNKQSLLFPRLTGN